MKILAITVEELEIKIRAEYGEAIKDIEKFVNQLQTAVKNKIVPIQGQLKKQSEQIVNEIAKDGDKITKTAAKVSKQVSKELGKMNLQTDEEIADIVKKETDRLALEAEKVAKAKQELEKSLVSTDKYTPTEQERKSAEWGRTPPQSKETQKQIAWAANLKEQIKAANEVAEKLGVTLKDVDFSKLGKSAQEIQNNINGIKDTAKQTGTAIQQIDLTKIQLASQKAQEATKGMVMNTPTLKKTFENVNQEINKMPKALSNAQQHISGIKGSSGGISKIFSVLQSNIGSFANRVSGVKGVIQKMFNSVKIGIKNISTSSQKTISTATSGLGKLGNILKRMLLYKSIYAVFNAIKEGVNNMAKGVEQANAVMSEYASSFTYLKNSIATMAMPALQAFMPVITALTDALAGLFNMLGGISARLFGNATTFIQAKKTAVDYADGVSSAANEAKKATGSFDQLNVLSFSNSSGSGGNEASMFEEVAIPEETIAFADKLRDMFEKIKEAAQPTITAINELKESLDPLKEFAVQGLTDFYTDFLVPVGGWLLGEGLPKFFEVTKNIVDSIDWANLNTSLKTFWQTLSDLTTLGFDLLIDFYDRFIAPIATFTLNEAIPRLVELFEEFSNNVDWERVKESLGQIWDVLSKFAIFVFDALIDFIEHFIKPIAEFVFNEALERVANVFTNLSDNVDWEKVKESLIKIWSVLSDLAILAFDALIGFVENFLAPIIAFVFNTALSDLADFFERLYDAIDWESMINSINDFWTALSNFFTEVMFTALMDFLNDFLLPLSEWAADAFIEFMDETTAFVNDTDWNPLLKALKDLWEQLEKLAEKVGEGLLWFYTDVILPFMTWAGENLIPAALKLVAEALELIDNVIDALKPLGEWLWEKFLSPIASWTGGVIVGVLEGLADVFDRIGNWVKENTDKVEALAIVVGSFAAAWVLVNAAVTVWELIGTIGTAVTTAFGVAVNILTSPITLVVAAIAALIVIIVALVKNWDTVKEVAENVWNKVKEVWNNFATWFDEKVWEPFKSGLKSVGNFFIGVWNGIISGFEKALNWIIDGINSFIGFVNKIIDGAASILSHVGINVSFNVSTIDKVSFGRVPEFAQGGVISQPTIGLMGEYANARTNPEIVSPQSLMYDTILEANGELASVFVQIADRIIKAIEENKTEVKIGDAEVSYAANSGNRRMSRLTGKA